MHPAQDCLLHSFVGPLLLDQVRTAIVHAVCISHGDSADHIVSRYIDQVSNGKRVQACRCLATPGSWLMRAQGECRISASPRYTAPHARGAACCRPAQKHRERASGSRDARRDVVMSVPGAQAVPKETLRACYHKASCASHQSMWILAVERRSCTQALNTTESRSLRE